MINATGDKGVEWLSNLCNDIIADDLIPVDWMSSNLVPQRKGRLARMQLFQGHEALGTASEDGGESAGDKNKISSAG